MSKDYDVRPYLPGDEEEIVELLQLVFKGWPKFNLKCSHLDHWKWKYLDNPLKNFTVVVATSENEVVGCAHYVYQRAKIANDTYLFPHGADVAVHPNLRRLGIHNNMRELRRRLGRKLGALEHYSVSANPILIDRNIRRGRPQFPHPVNIFVRIQDIDWHLEMMPTKNPWLKKHGFQIMKSLNKMRNFYGTHKPITQDVQVSRFVNLDSGMDKFWTEVREHYDFIIDRNRDRLRWRYCDPRGGEYIIEQAEENGKVLGYIVLRIVRAVEDYLVGYVVDLLSLPGRSDVADALLTESLEYFDKEGVNIITGLFIKDHPVKEILDKHGFLNSRERINIFTWASEMNKIKTSTRSKIHFSLGDFDHV